MTVALLTIAYKEALRVLRIWQQTLLPPLVTTFLYFMIFGTYIGNKVGQVEGFGYTSFIAPGLIMMAIVTNSYSNVASSLFSAKLQMHIEELLVSPVRRIEILLGFVAGGMIRGISVGALVIVLSLFFTNIQMHNPLLLLLTVFLSAFLFAVFGFINGLLARKFDDVAIIPTFILTPLIYVGGVFFTLSDLPSEWQTLARYNPMLYVINLFRYCLLGYSDVNPFFSFLFLCLAGFILTLIAFRMMRTNAHLHL